MNRISHICFLSMVLSIGTVQFKENSLYLFFFQFINLFIFSSCLFRLTNLFCKDSTIQWYKLFAFSKPLKIHQMIVDKTLIKIKNWPSKKLYQNNRIFFEQMDHQQKVTKVFLNHRKKLSDFHLDRTES